MPESLDPLAMFDSWLKSVNDFWSDTAASYPSSPESPESETKTNVSSDLWESGVNAWKSVAAAWGTPPPGMSSFQDISSLQKTFVQMAEPVFSNITQMLRQWQDTLATSADSVMPFDFQTIDKQALDIWKKLYDTEFRKFLKAPQLGLARERQEKVAHFLDRLTLLQSAMAEFLYNLAIPFKKAHADFQEKIADRIKTGKPPQDANDYYRIWLKTLEGHYMTLFQSPEYLLSLTKAMTASAACARAKKALINDLLQQMSIPSAEQLDAVYHDLHDLKKRLKNLEKTVTHR